MGDFWRRFARHKLGVIGLVLTVLLLLASIFAPQLAPRDYRQQILADARQPPGADYPFGADQMGRDVLSRLLFGGRYVFQIAFVSVAMGLTMGVVLGCTAGYIGGWVDDIIMRVLDVFLAFPYLLLAMTIVAALGPGSFNTTIAIAVWATPSFARVIRGSILALKEKDFIDAARAIGMSDYRIIWRHLIPNAIAPTAVFACLFMARAILLEAALSFLGLGVQPPQPSWGQMISAGRDYLRTEPHIITFPGIAIMLTVLGLNLFGEALRDTLDPKLK